MRHVRMLVVSLALAMTLAPALADGGAAHRAKQSPPVKMGTSGGSANDRSSIYCCSGTLGSLVMRDGVLSILSNNHVLARSGSAAAGEDTIQPGLIDNNCSTSGLNIIGDFPGNLVPLGTANVDAALSTARSGMVDATGAIIDVGVPCSGTQAPAIGLPVMKSGRTTGFTTGTIQSVNTSVSIQYQKGCGSGKKFTVSYTNQVVITPGTFSAGGDSGSLILSNDGTPNPVALLFAGSSSQTVGNPIQAVVSAFTAGGHTFSFVGTACGALAETGVSPVPTMSADGSQAPADASDASSIVGPSAAELAWATGIKERNEAELFSRPGVIGVGVGADEADSSKAAVIVYVSTASSSHPQPGLVPAQLEGVKVRVIPTDPFVAR